MAMPHPTISFIAFTGAIAILPFSMTPDTSRMNGPHRVLGGPGTAPIITDDRQVSQQHLQCVRDSFASYFHGGSSTTRHTTIGPAHVDVEWSSLKKTVDATSASGDTVRAVRIHYGLKTSASPHDYQFTIGVEVVRLLRSGGDNWRELPVQDAFYTVDGSGELHAAVSSGWGDDEVYFEHTFLRRASDITNFGKLNPIVDTRNFMFPWENELLPLHDDNSGCDGIRFVCITEPGERDGAIDKNMRHHLCAVALDSGTELVNNRAIDTAHPFLNKAADVGCPCPSICGPFAFPQHGIEVKNCP